LAREINADDLNRLISREDIRKKSVISRHGNRATNNDDLCIKMYKHTIDTVLPYLHDVFNKTLDSGQFPAQWSELVMIPNT